MNSEAAQKQRILIKASRHLVRQRRDTENAIRGFLCALGIRFARGSSKLAGQVRAALEERPDLKAMIEPLLAYAEALKTQIKPLDGQVALEAKSSAACRLLMTVPEAGIKTGVGTPTVCTQPQRRIR